MMLMDEIIIMNLVIVALIVGAGLIILKMGIKVVSQSEVYVIERFGKYSQTLEAGLSLIIPFLDRVAHRVIILERQLDEQSISVITKDNVEVALETRVFYRVVDASRSVYRIRDVDQALKTASSSIVRSAAGKLELDELQSSREAMNQEIATNLHSAAEVWGIDITRTEITDVIVDEATKDSQRQQLNAERKRRATIAEAEGDKRSTELRAEGELFKSQKEADAVRVAADAEAYAVITKANADAEQTKLLALAISKNGLPAVEFEIAKRQVDAIGILASSSNAKTIIIPTDVTSAIGALSSVLDVMNSKKKA
ncbi:SPFH/Band 7/PHB domain protein [Litorivicinus sp.]|nr:SPFH/Band 7/PHB domain protein [Litorivicinus sp.]MDC1209162.1 SPFH/Band 7/PHB domain protein [Litorivicinus sp.]MDC1319823.1 SPFH/Band 7/PHB domain protein [Litorivicinus sp.]